MISVVVIVEDEDSIRRILNGSGMTRPKIHFLLISNTVDPFGSDLEYCRTVEC